MPYWESRQAVARFAGDPVDRARDDPGDPKYLVELETAVAHYQVEIGDPPLASSDR